MANLLSPVALVQNLGNNQQFYEANAIPPNSRRGDALRNVRDNHIPDFFTWQVQHEGPQANTLAYYQQQFPGQAFGGLMGSHIMFMLFRR